MSSGLSPQNEQFIADAIAQGLFPSKEAAIDAAVDAMRQQKTDVPMVPDEHMAGVEEALAEMEAGIEEDMTDADWRELRQIATDAATSKAKA